MKPRYRAAAGLQQLRYQTPYDITSSAVYPLTSSNGSTIIICGHSTGLFVLWRGGRRLRALKNVKKATFSQDVMAIDDSDEEPSSSESPTPPEFEDEEEELDPRSPYPSIVQTLNLPLGTGVLQISTPQLSEAERSHLRPRLLRDHMLIALGCTDGDVRVLTIPMTPPSEASKARKSLIANADLATAGRGSWGEHFVSLDKGHRTIPTAVSVAVAPRSLLIEPDGSDNEDMESWREEQDAYDILVASGSADAGGTLLLHHLAIGGHDGAQSEIERGLLWRTILLDNVPTALDLYGGASVEPPIFPRVIVAEAENDVKVFTSHGWRSDTDVDLIAQLQVSPATKTRILSVKFGLAAEVALALTNDGDWGVWHLGLPSEHTNDQHIEVAKEFSYGGTLISTSLVSGGRAATKRQPHSKAIPAVTPHTRKFRQQELFDGDGSRADRGSAVSTDGVSRGGTWLIKTTHESGRGEDSSLLIWFNDCTIFIQSLRAHHRSRTVDVDQGSSSLVFKEKSGAVSANVSAQIKHLIVPDYSSLSGGSAVGVWPLLDTKDQTPSVRNRAPDAVYINERACTIVEKPRSEDSAGRGPFNGLEFPQQIGARTEVGRASLLGQGGLSLDAIEGMLDSMPQAMKRLSGRA